MLYLLHDTKVQHESFTRIEIHLQTCVYNKTMKGVFMCRHEQQRWALTRHVLYVSCVTNCGTVQTKCRTTQLLDGLSQISHVTQDKQMCYHKNMT